MSAESAREDGGDKSGTTNILSLSKAQTITYPSFMSETNDSWALRHHTPARWSVILSVLAVCLICDQATKSMALSFLSDGVSRPFFDDTVRLHLVANLGGFMGVGSSPSPVWQWLHMAWAVFVLTGVLAYALLASAATAWSTFAAALVFAGGLANLVDRFIHNGAVIDFISLNTAGLRAVAFNLADAFLVAGFFLLVVTSFVTRSRLSQHVPE